MSNANPNQPQPSNIQKRSTTDLPGRTALVSMFPLYMDPPSAPVRPKPQSGPRSDGLHGGK